MPTVCKHGENARACVVCKDDEIERLRELLGEAADDMEAEGVSKEWTKLYRAASTGEGNGN